MTRNALHTIVVVTVTSVIAIGLVAVNLIESAPYFGNLSDNQIKGPQTDLGWPCAWYSFYEKGYVHPWELLPFEVEPQRGAFHPFNCLADLIVIGITLVLTRKLSRWFCSRYIGEIAKSSGTP